MKIVQMSKRKFNSTKRKKLFLNMVLWLAIKIQYKKGSQTLKL